MFEKEPNYWDEIPKGLDDHFEARLERLVDKRSRYNDGANELGLELLDRAIKTTMVDCFRAKVPFKIIGGLLSTLPEGHYLRPKKIKSSNPQETQETQEA